MTEHKYEKQTAELVQAIKNMAANEDTLRNFQFYLEIRFGDWLKKHASTPDGIAWEFKQFASIARHHTVAQRGANMYQVRFFNENHKERGYGYSCEFSKRKDAEQWLEKLKKAQPHTNGTVVKI